MGFLVYPCCCYCWLVLRAAVRRLHWLAFSSQRERVRQLTPIWWPEMKVGVNRITHPDWVKLSVEANLVGRKEGNSYGIDKQL